MLVHGHAAGSSVLVILVARLGATLAMVAGLVGCSRSKLGAGCGLVGAGTSGSFCAVQNKFNRYLEQGFGCKYATCPSMRAVKRSGRRGMDTAF